MAGIARRVLLRSSVAAAAVGAGLLSPGRLLAAWPVEAFAASDYLAALRMTVGSGELLPGDIRIDVPDIASNAEMVSVTVDTGLPNVTDMAVFIVKNSRPLISRFLLGPGALPMFSIRAKMAETSDVVVAVKSGGTWYGAAREVKVTGGGCGG